MTSRTALAATAALVGVAVGWAITATGAAIAVAECQTNRDQVRDKLTNAVRQIIETTEAVTGELQAELEAAKAERDALRDHIEALGGDA